MHNPHAPHIMLRGPQCLIFPTKGNVLQVKHFRPIPGWIFPINRTIFLQEWTIKFFFFLKSLSRCLYIIRVFIDFSLKPCILSPYDRLLQDLEPSFYGNHFPRLLRRVKDDSAMVCRLDIEPCLLGTLKGTLQSNHSNTYDCASWEQFVVALQSFPRSLRSWSKQLKIYVRNQCLSYED